MYTSVVVMALAGLNAAPPTAPLVSWETSYAAAHQKGKQTNKPLAVFVGSGAQGWQGVSTTKALSPKALELLAQKYVCVYVDTSKPAGRDLADELAVRGKAGLVLSTRGGANQAFHHQGALTTRDLETTLKKHALPRRVVRTETLGTRSVRSSAPAAALKKANKVRTAPTSAALKKTKKRAKIAPARSRQFRPSVPSFGGGRGGC